jgi:aspartate/glutamate racemase
MTRPMKAKTLGIIRAMEPFIAKYVSDVEVVHLADDILQRDNICAGVGVIPKRNYYKFAQYAHNMEEAGVDMILLACSTFNYAAELARPMINIPIAQIDRPMYEEAVRCGKRIGLLATLNTTVPSSERLLQICAREAGKEITVTTVLREAAFEAWGRGDIETHNAMLLEEIEKLSQEVDVIAMAQLSMSALAPFLQQTRVPVLNSGDTGFTRVRQMLESME